MLAAFGYLIAPATYGDAARIGTGAAGPMLIALPLADADTLAGYRLALVIFVAFGLLFKLSPQLNLAGELAFRHHLIEVPGRLRKRSECRSNTH